MDFESMRRRAYRMGRSHATACIAAGWMTPAEAPLSGEWADEPTPDDVLTDLGVTPDTVDEVDVDELLGSWEAGYFEADWPRPLT